MQQAQTQQELKNRGTSDIHGTSIGCVCDFRLLQARKKSFQVNKVFSSAF